MVIALAFSFGIRAQAESARDELIHAYHLLKRADGDYAGHRVEAMHQVEAAGKDIGLALDGDAPGGEQQWKSDRKLREARRLLHDARNRLEDRDRDRAAAHVDGAIHEIDMALKVN